VYLPAGFNCSVICELCQRTSRSYTCVRILEELFIVINSCVLTAECNKFPLRIEPANLLQYYESGCLQAEI
jgi:hypothetical protein